MSSLKQLKKLADQKPDIMAESDDEEEPGRKPKKMKYDTEKSQLDDSGLYVKFNSPLSLLRISNLY